MGIVLGAHQYGKAEIHLVHVDRTTDRHVLRDLTVSTVLRGDFSAAHLAGDNSPIVATDTQKNVVYAFAREYGIGAIEHYAERLGRHFLDSFDWVTGAQIQISEQPWSRVDLAGGPSDHAFVQGSAEVRTCVVTVHSDQTWVLGGLQDLVVLKTTGSGFAGFPRDRWTTLPDTNDRILATSITARWRFQSEPTNGFDAAYAEIRRIMIDTFAVQHSLALQQTMFQMGEAALTACPELAEIRMSLPNKHHFVVDLSPFELDNPNIVFHADDRPYGKIEATIAHDDAVDTGPAWTAVPGFC